MGISHTSRPHTENEVPAYFASINVDGMSCIFIYLDIGTTTFVFFYTSDERWQWEKLYLKLWRDG